MPTNDTIQTAAAQAWAARTGPRMGDFIIVSNGDVRRIAHVYPNGVQPTSAAKYGPGSYYATGTSATYSGALDPMIPTEKLTEIDEVRPGYFWHFDGGIARAGAAVHYTLPCRVYRVAGTT